MYEGDPGAWCQPCANSRLQEIKGELMVRESLSVTAGKGGKDRFRLNIKKGRRDQEVVLQEVL